MAIIFGTREIGIIKTYKKQYISTELNYSIIPTSFGRSYLNLKSSDKHILLKRNKLSILVSVLRALINLFFSFSLLLFIEILSNQEFNTLSILFFTTVLIFFIWINFFLGKSNKEENKIREFLFDITGFYLLPEWLNPDDRNTKLIYENITTKFNLVFNSIKLEKININEDDNNFALFFTYVSFEKVMNPNVEIEKAHKFLIEKINKNKLLPKI